ncbi:hypothetical protein [Caldibacillus thermoamylovorans]|uniref:hypothetical protein n=1 Tax=Caldibacillus thermoamylovorans TaxID=35841 RepID=UPI001269DA70|nr:hypothetical protein [Caldibacillus thermoamylovorans]
MVTRFGLVAKIGHFSPQNGDENGSRHQNWAFFTSKWRRGWLSSPKTSIFHLKTVTRLRLVVKKWSFSPQNGDEKESRR